MPRRVLRNDQQGITITMDENQEQELPSREYLGDVVLSSGDKVKVYMPNIGDVFDMDFSKSSTIYRLAALACNMPLDKFKSLPILDGVAIVEKIGKGIEVLTHPRMTVTGTRKAGG